MKSSLNEGRYIVWQQQESRDKGNYSKKKKKVLGRDGRMDRVSLVGLRFYVHIRDGTVSLHVQRRQNAIFLYWRYTVCTPIHLLLENHIMNEPKQSWKQRKLFFRFRKIIYILGFGFQESNLVRELLAVVCDLQLLRRLGILD